VPTPAPTPPAAWVNNWDGGTWDSVDAFSRAAFNARFVETGGVIERTCSSCAGDYKTMVYKRTSAMPAGKDWYQLFHHDWFSANNKLNTDFKLYSSVADAKAGANQWNFCNYDDAGVGFPRDCGKTGAVGGQWNGSTRGGKSATWKMPTASGSTQWCTMPTDRNGFNTKFISSGVVQRHCSGCAGDYKNTVYKRTSPMPVGKDWFQLFHHDWFSANNKLNTDFKLYTNSADFLSDTNQWNFCNYDDAGVGFPRDCGKTGAVGGQWNGATRGGKTAESWKYRC